MTASNVPAPNDERSWGEIRKTVALPTDHVMLNAGSLSPTPWPVLAAVTELRKQQAAAPSDFIMRSGPVRIEATRGRLARYFNANPLDLVLLPNVTFAINIVAQSLRESTLLPAGSEILTTEHEYGAMVFCWQRLAKQMGLTVRAIPLPYEQNYEDAIVHAIEKAIGPKTKLLFFSHVTTQIGLVIPAARICNLARERGILTAIDGAHSPGMLPLDLAEVGADFYGGNGHKWMMAPAGTGFLHVRRDHRPMVQPLVTSWGWGYEPAKLDESMHFGSTRWQWSLEFQGVCDRSAQIAMANAVDYLEGIGREAITARVRYLSNYARKRFAETAGLVAATPTDPRLSGSLTAFDFPVRDTTAAHQSLFRDHHVEAVFPRVGEKTFLRISTGFFNTPGEIDQLAQALPALRKSLWWEKK
jgi:isopenicillin-N epimerase